MNYQKIYINIELLLQIFFSIQLFDLRKGDNFKSRKSMQSKCEKLCFIFIMRLMCNKYKAPYSWKPKSKYNVHYIFRIPTIN